MYNTKQIITYVDKDDILSQFSQLAIFNHFSPSNVELNIKQLVNSPLREDKHPSFILLEGDNGVVYYYDFADGDTGDCFDFAMKITGKTFKEVLYSLAKKTTLPITKIKNSKIINQSKSEFYPYYRAFSYTDKQYWQSYHISRNTLDFFKVSSLTCYRINGKAVYPKKAYLYKVGSRIKIYQPEDTPKFVGNTNKNSIQGYTQIDKMANELFIVSSLKEVMVMYELGFTAVAFNSESSLPKDYIIDYFKAIYDNIYILYDWDEGGYYLSDVASKKYNIPNITEKFIQKEKDLSDFVKENGLNKLKKLINNARN